MPGKKPTRPRSKPRIPKIDGGGGGEERRESHQIHYKGAKERPKFSFKGAANYSRRSILESRFQGEREKKALDEDPFRPLKKAPSGQEGGDKTRNGASNDQKHFRRASSGVRKKPGIQLGTQEYEKRNTWITEVLRVAFRRRIAPLKALGREKSRS